MKAALNGGGQALGGLGSLVYRQSCQQIGIIERVIIVTKGCGEGVRRLTSGWELSRTLGGPG